MVDLIPGTALPLSPPGAAAQPEGRGNVILTPARQPVSMLERLSQRDDISPAELMYLDAAVRRFDRQPPSKRYRFIPSSDTTDASTGNLALQLYEVPQGAECHLASVTVDTPSSATITPAAPYANAASYMFLAKAPPSTSDNDAFALSLRPGLIAFAPTAAGGPILPGQWTFGEGDAPVGFGGEMFWLVIVGGSQAAILGLTVTAKTKIIEYGGQGSN